jgi:asparagine N-glycosylation enzyme membrane subunit Stt3
MSLLMAAAEEHNVLLPAAYDITWALLVPLSVAAAIAALVHLIRRRDTTSTETALWALVVLLAPLLGPAVYFLAGRRRKDTTRATG